MPTYILYDGAAGELGIPSREAVLTGPNTGIGAITEAADTIQGTARQPLRGTGSISEANDVLHGTGTAAQYRQAHLVEASDVVHGTGVVTLLFAGTGHIVEGDDIVHAWTGPVVSTRLYLDISITVGMTSLPAGYGRYDDDGNPVRYRVDVLTPGGTRLATLENAALGNITWELNAIGSATFTMPLLDPKNVYIEVPDREVQIWRGPDLLWWGVIVRAQASTATVEFQCKELSWYLTRRVIGKAETNMISNGDFEKGKVDWWFGNYWPSEPAEGRSTSHWTIEVRNSSYITPISGEYTLFQWTDDVNRYGITSLQFFFWTVDANNSPEGDTWTVVAWLYLPSAEFVGARDITLASGLTVPTGVIFSRFSTTETISFNVPGVGTQTIPKPIEEIVLPITNDLPKDTWIRMEAPLLQPVSPGVTEWVQINLGTPFGVVVWDNISLVRNERKYFKDADEAEIVAWLVQHAQDPAMGKESLDIGTYCPLTGIKRTRVYEFFNHEVISECIDEFPQLFQGVDWSIEITPTTRTFTTYYPQRGSAKPNQALVLGRNIASVTVSIDGEQTSNRVMILADGGEGASREEAISTDPNTLTDGLILEKVYNATPGSAIRTLQAQANRGVKRYKDPVIMPELTTYEKSGAEMLGMLVPGDIVPVQVKLGWVNLSDVYRIFRISLNPHTEELSYTLNPYANWDLSQFR